MNMYRRFFIFVVLSASILIVNTTVVFAANETFKTNLYWGIKGNGDVAKLQEFLTKESYYNGPANGNFFTLTRDAVQKYQKANNIEPATGYFGPVTRESINNRLGKSAVAVINADKSVQIQALQSQINALLKQLAILQIAVATSIVQEPATTTQIVSEVVATSTPEVAAPAPTEATTTASLPNPFSSTLRIASTFPSFTTSKYNDAVLNELTFAADEKIAITSLKFTNSGTLPDFNFTGLRLVNSKTNFILATADMTNGVVTFTMVPDPTKDDQGLVVSGGTYNIQTNIVTPNYGANKPTIILDIKSSADVLAFDYNDLKRVANISQTSFPVSGPTITVY